MLRRSPTPHPAHGLLRQRAIRGPHQLLHLPEIQPGMENPHPPRFYTTSLTSPGQTIYLTIRQFGVGSRSVNLCHYFADTLGGSPPQTPMNRRNMAVLVSQSRVFF